MRRSDQSGGKEKNGKEKTRSRISNFAGKSVNPQNQLRRLRRAKGSRDFSQGLNRAWPPEGKREFLFFSPFRPISRSRSQVPGRYLHASIPEEKRKEKYRKGAKIARGEGKRKKKKNERLRERGVSRREEIHANVHRRDSACTFSYRFYLVGAHGPFPSAFAQPETARVRNRGKSELIVGKTPFSPRPAGVTRTSGGAPLSLPSPLSTRVNG